jgi:hypothetical protein
MVFRLQEMSFVVDVFRCGECAAKRRAGAKEQERESGQAIKEARQEKVVDTNEVFQVRRGELICKRVIEGAVNWKR